MRTIGFSYFFHLINSHDSETHYAGVLRMELVYLKPVFLKFTFNFNYSCSFSFRFDVIFDLVFKALYQ